CDVLEDEAVDGLPGPILIFRDRFVELAGTASRMPKAFDDRQRGAEAAAAVNDRRSRSFSGAARTPDDDWPVWQSLHALDAEGRVVGEDLVGSRGEPDE